MSEQPQEISKSKSETELESPLSEPNPLSLQELFARDPLELSAQEISHMVDELRRNRKHFVAEESKQRKSGKRVNGGTAAKAAAKQLKLDDLDLSI